MKHYIRFIARSDHDSRTKCTGVVTTLRILGEDGTLPDYHLTSSKEIFENLNENMPCPPFDESDWVDNCVCWFKNTPSAQEWISVFREIIAILEDVDIDVGTLTTDDPGIILYEDDCQVVADSRFY